jgi:ligand-binding sensor domain-containing protein
MIFFRTLWKKSSAVRYLQFFSIVLQLFFGTESARGQNDFTFHHLTTADGLTSNYTGKIVQDSRGFLWICTEDGLNMYDGQTMKQYYLSDYIPSQANSNFVSAVAEDVDHNILIAAKAGIVKFSWETKQFSVVYKNSFASFGNVNPDLFVDAEKNIWVNERVRIRQFDPYFHLMHTWVLRDSSNSKNLNGPSVTFISGEDVCHNIWFADSSFVFRIDRATNKIDSSENQKLKNSNAHWGNVSQMCFSEHSVWIIRNDHTLLHLDSSFQIINTYPLSLQITPYYTGVIEQNEKVWIATRFNGIFMLDNRTGQFQHYGESNSLASDNIGDIFKDASGNLWISTLSGIDELRANASIFHQMIPDVPHNSIAQRSTVHKAFFRNDTLYTFMSYGFVQTKLATNESHYFFDSSEKNSGSVYYTAAASFRDRWLISRHHNAEVLQFKNKRAFFSPIRFSHSAKLDSAGIVSFYEDRDKNMWMGLVNDGGVICWHTDDNTFSVYSQKDTGKNYCPLRHLSYATEDDQGNIWMGYDKGGVSIFDKNRNRFVPIPLKAKNSFANVAVLGIASTQDNLWIATNTGLIQYNEKTDSFKVFTRKDGLPSNFVKSLIADDAGNLWTGFEGALAEINLITNSITTYNAADGLPGEDLENPSYDAASGMMLFCTDKSVVYFDPKKARKIIPSLEPIVTSFQVMGKEQPVTAGQKLEIPYSQDYLSFTFSAPNFLNASETEYACKLEGADKNWNYLGNHHFAGYSQLPPGGYTFKVMARVKGGKWQESATPVEISILTPFWKALWFWMLCLVVLLLLIFSFIYLRLRNRFEKKILAQSIRDKIAGDLHDDIGSTLSSISILSELAKQNSLNAAPYLENISRNTSLIQENMNDIVWAINPKNDRFVNIIQHMSQFAAEVLEPKNIEVNFNSDESLSSLLLPMDKRKNFYLFFKEAINNCAKYSMAERVDILISCHEKHISLKIADDGKGFDTSRISKGNGMSTMKKRAAELGGRIEIFSVPGRGTAIDLDFAL